MMSFSHRILILNATTNTFPTRLSLRNGSFFYVANHIENKCGNKKLANFFEFGDSGGQFFSF